ncbi:MAG: tetratricopeptide repeat protein, partial [Myxococcales bacterium]
LAAATPGEEEVPAALTAAADPTAQPVASGEVLDAPSAAAPEPAPEAQQKPEPRPGDVDDLLAQGRQLYDRGQPKAALKPLERAAELAPDNSDIQVLLALARLDLGRLGPAEQAARRALELDASNARAHLVLGTVSQERGDTKRARSEYEEYLRLAPSGEHAKDVQAILSSMR